MGYIIEYMYNSSRIRTTFWVIINNNKTIVEKRLIFDSLENLYEQSKSFINTYLINNMIVHPSKRKITESKYKMMCDFIAYYESKT